jgi:hypothetical protein
MKTGFFVKTVVRCILKCYWYNIQQGLIVEFEIVEENKRHSNRPIHRVARRHQKGVITLVKKKLLLSAAHPCYFGKKEGERNSKGLVNTVTES